MTRLGLVLIGATVVVAGLAGCRERPADTQEASSVDLISDAYIKLVLAVGQHDPNYVDAYYGPPAFAEAAQADTVALLRLKTEAEGILQQLNAIPVPAGTSELRRLRRSYLGHQLASLAARVDLLMGAKLSFDEESQALYNATAPHHDEAYFREVLQRIDSALPGEGSLVERYAAFKKDFIIPKDRLDTVFTRAIAECRDRTARYVTLPAGEEFTVEYVTDKPWSGYNWYQGNLKSVIQVNTDLPIYIDRAVDLACHEGYPGHHVYNSLLESELVRGRDWTEFTVYALFSPQSLIAEGSANYGIKMAFPGDERATFERDVLFPLAGLDPARAEAYYRVQGLVAGLGYAGNEAARNYLDGRISREEAVQWLMTYALMDRPRAEQRVRFIDTYRSYVINYNLGQDLVRAYVERKTESDTTAAARWRAFAELLASPRLPEDIE